MSSLSPENSRRTGEVRALRIGVLGGSAAAVVLALALVSFFFLYVRALERARWSSDGVEVDGAEAYGADVALFVAMCVLPVLALVVLPTTGYLAASGADTRPGRSGAVAAGVVSAVHFIVFAGTSTVLHGRFEPFPGGIVLLTPLTGGVVMLGVAVGVSRWNRDRH